MKTKKLLFAAIIVSLLFTFKQSAKAQTGYYSPSLVNFDVAMTNLLNNLAQVPHKLLEQLRTGGRLIAIVGDEPIMSATLFTRVGDTDFHSVKLWDANAPRLENFAETSQFVF